MNIQPDVVLLQQDPWNFPAYLKRIENTPVIGIVAVDGKNCRGGDLNGLALAVFWTEFGREQARLGGYEGPSTIIPLGVDLQKYFPKDRAEARDRIGISSALRAKGLPASAFIVGTVGRNQQRKRLDLTLEYFADWIHADNVHDAILFLHIAPTGEDAYDLDQLVSYYGLTDRVLRPSIEMWYGVSEETLSWEYSTFNVLLTTTQGEGFGLPAFESLACGIPVIAPDWSALGELLKDAAFLVPCTSTAATPDKVNAIGGIMDRREAVRALSTLYSNVKRYADLREAGLCRVREDRFRWPIIGQDFDRAIQSVVRIPESESAPEKESISV
jgi:glycosyltransferase involved in cell wall biosynthesis